MAVASMDASWSLISHFFEELVDLLFSEYTDILVRFLELTCALSYEIEF
jgi:hypothetical protein